LFSLGEIVDRGTHGRFHSNSGWRPMAVGHY
jgi:hypothetical protein